MSRYQIEDRIIFTREQKEYILSKSSCKCAKCGMALTVNDMTVEHVVPLSKGGTNDDKNLVALCYDCNQIKSNYVLHPLDYYGYVKKEYMIEIIELFYTYLDEIPWYGRRNYTKEDKKLFYYDVEQFSQIRKSKKGGYIVSGFRNALTFERVYIDEINDIYNFVKSYNDKYNIDSTDLMSYLEEIFSKGCIYKIYSKNSIIAILPFTVESFLNENDKRLYKLKLNGIPNKYQREQYADVIFDAIVYVMSCLSELNYLNATTCVVDIPKADKYLAYIVDSLHGHYISDVDEWDYYLIDFIVPQGDVEEHRNFMYEDSSSRSYDKIEEVVSDSLERCLHLPSLQKKKEKEEAVKDYKNKILNNDKSAKSKKKKRYKHQYDEYDMEYYLK